MKKLITWQGDILKKLKLIFVFFYFLFQTSNIFASERWVLDKSLSTIEFELPVLFAKNVKGQFNTIEGFIELDVERKENNKACLLYTSPSPRDATLSRMPSSA